MTWFLDLRAQSSGGGMADAVAVYDQDVPDQLASLRAAVAQRHVLLVTHGFNVDRAAGRRSLSFWQSWQSLPDNSLYVAVLWPGDSAFIPAIDYPIEGNEAIAAGKLLARFILDNFQGAASLSFVSHSLGARMVLQTIRGLGRRMPVRRLILMAGAIDDTCLVDEYADAASAVEEISVLASYNDEVLSLAFPIGNLAAGLITRGDPYWHAALGREGAQGRLGANLRRDGRIPDSWAYGHGSYLPTGPAMSPPLPAQNAVPPVGSPQPDCSNIAGWRTAWSAAFVAGRFR